MLELATAFSENVIPLIKEFANGLTGSDGVNESLTESEQSARAWGERLKAVIKIVVSLKDELIVLAGILATVFVVSKIAAAVQGTIVLITSLIKAYNLLKASAIVAGVASAFALNPLLGVGAVALAAGVLSAANALAAKGDISTAGLTGGGVGGFSGTRPDGTPFSTGDVSQTPAEQAQLAASKAAALAESKIIIAGQAKGLTAEQSLAEAKAKETVKVDPAIAAASKKAAEASENLNKVLNRINGVGGVSDIAAARRGEEKDRGTTINLTVNGAMDKEGTARTIVDTLNNSYYRGTGGATALVAI